FFFSSRRRHTRSTRDWSSDVCSSDLEAASALRRRDLSSHELVSACLARIHEGDGEHSFEGDPRSINAWVRVYEEDALEAAGLARSEERRVGKEGGWAGAREHEKERVV